MLFRERINSFGKSCLISIHASDADARELAALSKRELRRLESRFSSFHPESLISQINRSAGNPTHIELDSEARSLFEYATTLWSESRQVYDPTIGIVSSCYSEDGALRATPPQVSKLLALVGWSKLQVNESGAYLSQAGMQIDLDNCVRVHALDSIRKLLARNGVQHACIEFDRDAVTIGKQPDGSNWLLGVRHPYHGRTAIARIKLNNKGFSQQGIFDQGYQYNGEYYGRALSPVDGYPIPGLLSVTCVGDTCLDAYSAAMLARLRTEESGLGWLQKLGLPWMAIDRHLGLHGPLAP
ncbi:FAD:protein FMN transferase [Haliea sp. E17]|uniref:FAD:protein FMN transferase n=1 Tax=Haliea sp. E17 TaxID=3401576 RepID=UPI003AAF38E5